MHAENILARRYFYPGCHRMEPYRTLYPGSEQHLQQTEQPAPKSFAFPRVPLFGGEEIRAICGLLRFVVLHGAEVRGNWPVPEGFICRRMHSTVKVSVLLITYNHEPFVRQALDSV